MTQIAMTEPGPAGPARRLARALASAGALDRVPPGILLLLAIVSIQLSSGLATFLFSSLGPAGTAFLTVAFSGAILTLAARPRVDRRLVEAAGPVLLLGLANAAMILPYFLALERIPLGIVAAVAFLGPLGLAVATSRRFLHFAAIGVAALGVALLTPDIGGRLDPLGVALAGLVALAWAASIPLTKAVGRKLPGYDGLTFGFWIASLLLLPLALAEGSMTHAGGLEIAGALVVALLNAGLPGALEYRALQRLSARSYGVLMTLEPAIGALVGALMLGQAITLRMSAAIACVTLAALGITLLDREDAG